MGKKKDSKWTVQEYNDYIDELYPPSDIFGVKTKSSIIFKNLHPDKWSDGLDIFLESPDGMIWEDLKDAEEVLEDYDKDLSFEYDPTDDLVDEPLTEQITWEGKDYFIYDREENSAVPNGVLYLYKTYHKPTGTLSYPIIKLYLDGNKIKEWTDDEPYSQTMEKFRTDI